MHLPPAQGRHRRGLGRGRRGGRGHLRAPVPGARLPAAGGRGQLDRRRGSRSRWRSPASGPTRTRSRSPTPSTCRPERVRVVYPAIGGAFGGREDMSLQIVHGARVVAAGRAGRAAPDPLPVVPRGVDRRPPQAPPRAGPRPLGRHGRRAGGGGRGHLPPRRRRRTTTRPTRCWGTSTCACRARTRSPTSAVDSHGVLTNAVPGGAFRGFGAPQGAFVAETQMNKLAERLGLDPVELRRRNLLRDGSIGPTGTEMPPGVSLPVVVDRCAEAAGWAEPLGAGGRRRRPSPPCRRARTRCGAAGASPAGSRTSASRSASPSAARPGSSCTATTDGRRGRSSCSTPAPRSGQGSHTAFVQMAAEAVGVPVERVEAMFSDTAVDRATPARPRPPGSPGCPATPSSARPRRPRSAWRAGDRPAVGEFRFVPPPTEPLDAVASLVTPNFAYTYGAQAVDLTRGRRDRAHRRRTRPSARSMPAGPSTRTWWPARSRAGSCRPTATPSPRTSRSATAGSSTPGCRPT